jgi:hypothetical protein
MIRIGRYDAHDKWDILCRYWVDPAAVPPIIDKRDGPALPNWQDLALAGGRYACDHYLELKLAALGAMTGTDAVTAPGIDGELAALKQRFGYAGCRELVSQIGPMIVERGFPTPVEALSPTLNSRFQEVFKGGALHLLRWSDMPGEIPSVEVLRTRCNAFPARAMSGKRRVLSLFCALNYGRSDVIHIHDVCPHHVTLVDRLAEALNDMRLIYPTEWDYIAADCLEFLSKQAAEYTGIYDLVVADTPLTLIEEVNWTMLPSIMRLCSDMFITNYTRAMCDQLGAAPDDLAALSRTVTARTNVDVGFVEMMPRNDYVYWAVMRKR